MTLASFFRVFMVIGTLFLVVVSPTRSWAATGKVYLIDNKAVRHEVADISLAPKNSGHSYRLNMQYDRFTDYFLSMKEMKCLEGPELMCHLPYPYRNPHWLSDTELHWLEHDLLFMFKQPSEYGANFWNGILYRLTPTDYGYSGIGMAVDLNELAAPPDDLDTPAFKGIDLEELSTKNRWLPRMEIRLVP
ncbi:hypothetical protein [Sedimenticola sp.]|uniref:hypothetical protein n=1 Tax=Sedimenticola sp. TaxID=1940285 RepID=UPI003D0EE868